MRRGVLAAFTTLTMSAPVAAATITDETLPNGLHVVIGEDHHVPLVAVAVRYGVGSAMDPEGRAGLNALTMWLLGHKTVHVPDDGFATNLDRVGASWRYWSNLDDTEFYTSLPSNNLELALWLLSEQMGFFTPAIDKNAIDNRLAMVNLERAQRVGDGPDGLLQELIPLEIYPVGHPYRKPSLPRGVLSNVTPEEVRAFAERWYVPRNAVLVIEGDVRSAPTMSAVMKYFGSIASGNQAPITTAARPPALDSEIRLDLAAHMERPIARMDWPTPAAFDTGDADLDLVAAVLAGNRINRLRWELTGKRKIATDFYVHQESHRLGSRFVIQATGVAGHSPQELLDGIDDVLRAWDSNPITDDDRLGALGFVVVPKVLGVESALFRVRETTLSVMRTGNTDFFEQNFARYPRVDLAHLQAAVRTWLPLQRRIVTTITPGESAPLQGVLKSRTVKPSTP
jgi:zinc protease